MDGNIFLDANVIYDAGTKAMTDSKFKYATQLFEMNHLLYTAMLQQSLLDGSYTPSEGNKFLIRERGKPRYITSNSMADKAINHLISDEVLMPALSKYLIYDNGASQKGKDDLSLICTATTFSTGRMRAISCWEISAGIMRTFRTINAARFWSNS